MKYQIISLDGASWEILNKFEDEMGFLSGYKNENTSAELLSTTPPSSPAAWSSFQTGVSPKDHGIIDFFHLNNMYELTPMSVLDSPSPTIWKKLNQNGIKAIPLNVPSC